MKLYIKDNKIVKTIFSAGHGIEIPIKWADVVEMADDISYYIYEDWVKLYKNSQRMLDRKAELILKQESADGLADYEQQELDWILTMSETTE